MSLSIVYFPDRSTPIEIGPPCIAEDYQRLLNIPCTCFPIENLPLHLQLPKVVFYVLYKS